VNMYFMICDPPESVIALKKQAEDYVTEHQVLKQIETRLANQGLNLNGFYVSIRFMKPTEIMPIGWKAKDEYEIQTTSYMEGLVYSMNYNYVNTD